MYFPDPIYESQPYLYFGISSFALSNAVHWGWYLAATMLYMAGSTVWIARSRARRTDQTKYWLRHKKWPEIPYEFKPFIYIAAAITVWHLTPTGMITPICILVMAYAVNLLVVRAQNRQPGKKQFARSRSKQTEF